MSVKDFEILRQHMLVEISAGTFHVSDVIGKAALDERVMAAMGKVPRHEFVPVDLSIGSGAHSHDHTGDRTGGRDLGAGPHRMSCPRRERGSRFRVPHHFWTTSEV